MYDFDKFARVELGLRIGLKSVADAVAWADAEILRLAAPTEELFAISLASKAPAAEVLQMCEPILRRAPEAAVAGAVSEWAESVLSVLQNDLVLARQASGICEQLCGTRYLPLPRYEDVQWIESAFYSAGEGKRLLGIQSALNPFVEAVRALLQRIVDDAPARCRAPAG